MTYLEPSADETDGRKTEGEDTSEAVKENGGEGDTL
jgi:hypothetical protein